MTRDGTPEVYVAGLNNETLALPELAGQTKDLIDGSKLEDLKKTTVALLGKQSGDSKQEDDLQLVRGGLCFRPVSESGVPIISRVENISIKGAGGLYIASGHGPWGISLSLGTGFVVSEVLQGRPFGVPANEFGFKEQTSLLRARL